MNRLNDNNSGASSLRSNDELEAAAGMWLARRDRGLTAEEVGEFAAWLDSDPRHRAHFEELEHPFTMLDRASGLRPRDNTEPDPDLLAPAARSRARSLIRVWLPATCAAGVAFAWFLLKPPATAPELQPPGFVLLRESERLELPDGSLVDLKQGARVKTAFTPTDRLVRLTGGEAHFTVSKDPARPFAVIVDTVVVQAVGTAFSVSREPAQIAVKVAEGRVRVKELSRQVSLLGKQEPTVQTPPHADAAQAIQDPEILAAGEQVIILLEDGMPVPGLARAMTPKQMEDAFAWRSVWLEFAEMPLADVAAEFNRHNGRRLRVANPVTGRILITGKFRVDGLDAFVRLLESSFDVSVSVDSDGSIVLKKLP